jgi:flagellar basal body-associated protein FliL
MSDGKQDGESSKPKKDKKKSKKLIVLPVVVLLVAGVGYKMFLAPKPAPPKMKIAGAVVALDKEFIVNLTDGHYGKLSVALVVDGVSAPSTSGSETTVDIPEEPVIRSIITDDLTGLSTADLTDRTKRTAIIATILADIKKKTDEKVTQVLFTDLAVQ